MTKEQANNLHIGLSDPDELTLLLIESALSFVLANTSLSFNMNDDAELAGLPAPVKLFVARYVELQSATPGVTSESIEGLSQSFSSDRNGDLWSLAQCLLGPWLTSGVTFYPMKKARRYGR